MKDDITIPTMTVTPVPMLSRLQVSGKEREAKRVRRTMLRWMQRAAVRLDRFINEPSLMLETEYEPDRRRTFLYTRVDSIPDTAPEFLRRAKIDHRSFQVPFLGEVN